MSFEEKYYTIIGDFVDSQNLSADDRYKAQEDLKRVLNRINRKYKENIKSNFEVGAGDEFQGNLISNKNILRIIHEILLTFTDFNVRFGVGYGTLSTKILKTTSFKSDGESWYYARDSIRMIESENDTNTIKVVPNIRFKLGKDTTMKEEMINTILSTTHIIFDDWTKRQREIAKEIVNDFGFDDSFVQKNVAKKLQISNQLLNKTLKSMRYYNYIEQFRLLQRYLEEGIL